MLMLKVLLVVTILLSSLSPAQSIPIAQSDVERIIGASMTRGGAIDFLETLSDRIGGRMTGSPESAAAASLILTTLTDAGLHNAHVEDYPIEAGWKRGQATARVISPVSRPIYIGSYGWAPGTNGPLQAPVVETSMSPRGILDLSPSQLKGAAVIVSFNTRTTSYATSYVVLRAKAIRQCANAGAVAMLIPSDKPHRMLYTSAYLIYPRAAVPVLSVAREDALFLHRLRKKGPVKLEFDVHNQFTPTAVSERNVIAEIPGTGKDIVVVGAHFDSWDWAQGANDNGSGVAAVIEAARILNSLGHQPKATIRFALFSGEEQGCLGSRAYLEAHKAELGHHRMFIFMDGGAQSPVGIALKGRRDLVQPLTPLIEPLKAIGANHLIPDGEVGSDDESFIAEGIPAIELMTEPGEYDINHHAITDTVDKIDARMLSADTAGIALMAAAVANSDPSPGRRLQPAEILQLLNRTHLLEEVRLMRGSNWIPE